MRARAGFSVGMLMAAALGCSSPDLQQDASVYRLAAAAAQAKPEQPEAALTPAEASEPEPTVDPEFQGFDEEVMKSCRIPPEPMATSEMVDGAVKLMECSERRTQGWLARVPRAQRSKLLSLPPPAGSDRRSWYPAWERFVKSACYLQDAQEYSSAAGRQTGTIRSVTWPSCFASANEDAAYWIELLAKNDAARFARHLRRMASIGRRAEKRQDDLATQANRLASSAYESGRPDDDCRMCELGDADFRKVVRIHAAVRQSALDLAEVTCNAWPQLVEQLGGTAACLELARLRWRAVAGGGWAEDSGIERWLEDDATEGDRRRPVVKDPDYARFLNPVYSACEQSVTRGDEDVVPCLEATRRRELSPLKLSRANDVLAFEADFGAFVSALCPVVETGASYHYSGSWRAFDEKSCRSLAIAHAAFLAHSWSTDDDSTFRRHMTGLVTRAPAVEFDLKRWAEIVVAKPCVDTFPLGTPCRWMELGAATWTRTQRALERLHPAAAKLAGTVCRGWPALATAVRNEQESCEQRLTQYFIAYADLGAVIAPAQN